MASEQIIIEYVAQVEGLKAQLRTVQTELKGVQSKAEDSAKKTTDAFKGAGESIKSIATGIAGALGLAFSVGKVIQFAQESIKAFQESEAVARKLEFAITKIGKEGQAAFDKLNKQADIFAKKTIFDDESIRSAQTMLAQFGLQSDAIEDLIPKIIDLASATGQDLQSATQLAISGINGQGRALKPYGIILDDTGSKTENLRLLTEGLAKFTGSAGEAFNTAAGQAKFYDNQINELQESIGEKLSPVLQKLQSITLKGINNDLSIFSAQINALILGLGSDDQKFNLFMERFVNASEEAQTKIAFDLAQKGSERTELEQRLFIEYRKILDARLNATADEQKAEIGLTQKGIDAKIAAEKKRQEEHEAFIEKQKKLEQERFESDSKLLQQKVKEEKEYRDNKLAAEKKLSEDRLSLEESFNAKARAFLKKVEDEEKEKADKKKRDDEDIADAEVQLFTNAANAIFEYQNQRAQIEEQREESIAQKERERIQKLVDNKVITEEEGAKQIAGIDKNLENKKKEFAKAQAKRDKEQALFNIAIDTLVASIKALPNAVLSGIILALGAVAAAAVLAKPVPEFAEGVIDLKGGVRGKDSIPALLMPGESVMTTAETERHGELLRSIRSKKLDEYIMDNYVNPKLSTILSNSTAENIAKSAKLNGLNEYSLARVMSRNRGVNVQNADYLAKAIAREMRSDNVKRTWSA